jgi:hypothetical protein
LENDAFIKITRPNVDLSVCLSRNKAKTAFPLGQERKNSWSQAKVNWRVLFFPQRLKK